jgi:hypothetical protein
MTTNFQKLLRDKADSTLFSGKGDGERDGKYYLANEFDCFLSAAAEAVAADGIDRKTIMRLFISHALEVLDETPGVRQTPITMRGNADVVLQEAMKLHSIYDHRETGS